MQFKSLFASLLIVSDFQTTIAYPGFPPIGAFVKGAEEALVVGEKAVLQLGEQGMGIMRGAGLGLERAGRGAMGVERGALEGTELAAHGIKRAEGTELAAHGIRRAGSSGGGISQTEIQAIDHVTLHGHSATGSTTPKVVQAGEREALHVQNIAKTAEIEAAKHLEHMERVALAQEHDQFEFIYRVGEKGGDFKKKFSELRPKDFPSNHPFDPKTGTSTVHPPHEGNGLSANRYPDLAKEQSGDVLWKADRSEIQKGGKFKIHDDSPASNADNPTHSSIANTQPMTVDELKAELNHGWTPVERRITTKLPDGTKTYRWEPIPEAERAKYMGVAPPAKPVKAPKAPKPGKPQAAGNGNQGAARPL